MPELKLDLPLSGLISPAPSFWHSLPSFTFMMDEAIEIVVNIILVSYSSLTYYNNDISDNHSI